MLALHPRKKETSVTKNNFEKPKFYNSHRSRQLYKKESNGPIKTQKTFIKNIKSIIRKLITIPPNPIKEAACKGFPENEMRAELKKLPMTLRLITGNLVSPAKRFSRL